MPLGAAAGIVALATMSRGARQEVPLSYSRFLADVGAGSVRAVTIDPAGQVAGRLTTGQPFTTTIPVALDDRTLAGRLLQVLIGGLFYVGVRGARRDTGGLRGPPGTGRTLLARAPVRRWLWQRLRRSLTVCWFCCTGSRARRPTDSR